MKDPAEQELLNLQQGLSKAELLVQREPKVLQL